MTGRGPLHGVRVVELAAIGPVPFAGMLLADLGATVTRVDRVDGGRSSFVDMHRILDRGRRSIAVDVKRPEGRAVVRRLVERADVLLEGFRPGVAERLGLGPDDCLAWNPRLVYGRMTGWGQSGPLAQTAGHDINYIALAGALHGFGRAGQPPVPPANLLGDFGGGGLLLAFGVACALLERRRSGAGQVIDASIVDGTAAMLAMQLAMAATGSWCDERGSNLLDTGAPFYDVYACAGGGHVAVGAIEEPFYRALLAGLGLSTVDLPDRADRSTWPVLRARFAAAFATRTRDEWAAVFAGTDACVTPVLSAREAAAHPQPVERGVFVERDGLCQPAPAPRFSRTPGGLPGAPPAEGAHTRAVLAECGLSPAEIDELLAAGAVREARPAGSPPVPVGPRAARSGLSPPWRRPATYAPTAGRTPPGSAGTTAPR